MSTTTLATVRKCAHTHTPNNNITNDFYSVNDHGFPEFSIPNSNAFLDFDGDCHPDLFFTEKVGNDTKFSIWIWNPENAKFERNKTYSVPRGAGQVSFSDFSKNIYTSNHLITII